MHTKHVLLIVGAVLGACTVGAATVGADIIGTLANPKRLNIISKATAINNFVDVGPAGPSPGDLYVFSDEVFNASDPSTKIGQADGRCVLVDPGNARFGCTIITSLPTGDIMTEGTLTTSRGKTNRSVTCLFRPV